MNGRPVLLWVILLVGFIPLRDAAAQPLPADVRTTTNAAAVRDRVQTFVKEQVANLTKPDPVAQKAGRDAIIAEVQGPSTGPGAAGGAIQPSAPFLDAYADVLSEALKPLAKNQDNRVRLNVAVLASRVAEKANNARLVPLVVDLLADQNEAVVLWAVKASKPLLPPLLVNPATAKTNPLVPALVTAATKNVKSGPIMQSVYETLSVEPAAVPAATLSAVVPIVAATVQDLMAMRLDLYKAGIPEMPQVDTAATTFLTYDRVWRNQPPAMQLRTVQLASDLLGLAAQRFAVPQVAGTVQGADLRSVIRFAAAALSVVGVWTSNQAAMDAAVKPLATLSPSTSGTEIQTHVAKVHPGLIKIKAFESIKPPPKIP